MWSMCMGYDDRVTLRGSQGKQRFVHGPNDGLETSRNQNDSFAVDL
jgi:hypothetical protein